MNIEIKYGRNINNFDNCQRISVGDSPECDFYAEDFNGVVELIFSEKYNTFVLVNTQERNGILFNNKPFKKVLAPANFSVTNVENSKTILFVMSNEPGDFASADSGEKSKGKVSLKEKERTDTTVQNQVYKDKKDIFNNPIENNRIAIVKEIGYKIQSIKSALASLSRISFVADAAILILSVICSFGMTNFILQLPIDTSKGVLNLTTNFGFLICISLIVFAVSFSMKQSVYSLLEANQNKRYGDTVKMQQIMVYASITFMFIIYAINLMYYRDINFMASVLVSLLFVGALGIVSAASGYFKFQLRAYNYQLTTTEYREDFENVLKGYRGIISAYINSLSDNRIDMIKSNLLNCQMRMIGEVTIGLLTAPFLAYGVSNTLAACFPEAAGWVRISGLRFSPIFLVLATFLIIFAFFSFVRAFTIGKQIKSSEIIKFDGFHDYSSHGVNILGIDSIKNLNKEKNVVLFIACAIIAIEFTMNVSYFIQEIGGDSISGIFQSAVAALVPTALLLAETHMLSSTMHKINNYNEVLSTLD